MPKKKSRYYPPNKKAVMCCNCRKTVLPGDGYTVRGRGYPFNAAGWGVQHGGEYGGLGEGYKCEPGKLLRLRAEEARG